MRFTTIITFLLPAVILAAPAVLEARAGEYCAPTSYTLTDFIYETKLNSASIAFKFKSTFADINGINDTVIDGTDCNTGSISSIPNNNVCNVPDRKLLFDLRGPPDTAHYQITHTWVCNRKTWMSGNDVTVGPLECDASGDTKKCTAGPQTIVPQNVRQICNAPSC